jgi:glycosyltransferase involved in cell wall biosynthesis
MRTQGSATRLGGLDEALTCLAGQSDQRFEVVLVVHAANAEEIKTARASVTTMVGRYGPMFAEQIRIIDAVGGDRARPLNVGLDNVRGDLVTFLDDDDYVTVDFVATLNDALLAAPGRVIRTVAAERFNSHFDADVSFADAPTTVSVQAEPFRYGFNPQFDFMRHYWQNETPIHAFAVPMRAVDTFGWRFDETLPVVEDWQFLMTATALLGVHDTEIATSIYNRWISDQIETSADIDRARWHQAQLDVLDHLGQAHVILPPGSPRKIYERTESWQRSRPEIPLTDLARELARRGPRAVVGKTRRIIRPRTRLWTLRLWWRSKRSK